MYAQVQPSLDQTDGVNTCLAWRSWASFGIQSFSPDLQAMARVEAVHPESELRPLVRRLYAEILVSTVEELEVEHQLDDKPRSHPGSGRLDEERVSYAFSGALENMGMRASWDERYGRRDVMRNLLVMYIAVRAVFSGRLDPAEEGAAVAAPVDRLAGATPVPAGGVSPPGREESPPCGSRPPG
jgi:hypothetical protein